MIYDYQCDRCDDIFEVHHPMNERPIVHCEICGALASKLISLPHTHKDLLYNFIDVDTTGKPIQFNTKGQWKKHLKSRGLTDDIPQSAPRMEDLKPMRSEKTKEQKRKEYKEVAVQALRENKVI